MLLPNWFTNIIFTHTHARTHAYARAHAHIHAHAHTHTRTHTYTQVNTIQCKQRVKHKLNQEKTYKSEYP